MDDFCWAMGMLLAGLAVPVAFVGLVVIGALFERISRLERRLVDLELRLTDLPTGAPTARTSAAPASTPAAAEPDPLSREATAETAPTPPIATDAPPQAEIPTVVEPPPGPPPGGDRPRPPVDDDDAPPPPFALPSPERLVVWLGAAIGGFAILLAALFALVTFAERGWIGPSARIASGLVGGMGLWVGGTVARRWWPVVGSALAGAGIGTLYGSAYAASSLYGLMTPSVASALMIGVTVVATLRATADRDRFVAWLALIGGVLTPWLVSTGENHPYALFLYLTLLAAGMVTAASIRSWPDLIVGTAVGVAGLHLGWTASWYTASQVPPALFGALVLTVPFAAAACTQRMPVRVTGAIAASLLPMLALAWVVPVGSSFYDPRSGLWAVRSEPLAGLLAALAPAVLALPAAIAARRHRNTLQAAVALAPVLWLGWTWALGVAGVGIEPTVWTALGAIAPAVVLALVSVRDPASAAGFVPAVGLAGVALSIASGRTLPEGFAGALIALALAAAVLSARSRDGWTVAVAIAGVALPAWVGTSGADPVWTRYTVGPALIALALAVQGPIRRTWDARSEVAWSSAALGAVALFPPLYFAWVDRLGEAGVGLLPLLLAVYVLLAGVALARRAALDSGSIVVAVFVMVVLAGITTAVPLELHERWLTVAWAVEAAALARIAHRVKHPLVQVVAVALCLAVGVRLLANPWALSWGTADEGWVVLNWTLYAWGVPLACVLLVARWLPSANTFLAALKVPLWVLAALIGFALVNVEVSHAFQPHGPLALWSEDRMASMVRSAAWAAYGLVVLGVGLVADQRVVRLIGFAFVLLATLKVFGYDLWDLRGFVRVGSIGCLGVALLLAALAFERLVLRSTRKSQSGRGSSADPVEVS